MAMYSTSGTTTLSAFFQSNQFEIPYYQRDYCWKLPDCEDFLESLTENSGFFGEVYVQQMYNKPNFVEVIDGQQRLTTFSLLLRALYDTMILRDDFPSIEDKEFTLTELEATLFTDDNPPTPRIINSQQPDGKILTQLLNQGTFFPKEKDNLLIKNYQYFLNTFESMSTSELKEFFLKHLNNLSTAAKIVPVTLSMSANAQKIFEHKNATGQPLTTAEKVINFISMKAPFDDKTSLYEDYLSPLKTAFKNTKSGEGSDGFSTFIRRFLSYDIGDKVYSVNCYRAFVQHFNAQVHQTSTKKEKSLVCDLEEFNSFLEKFRRCAAYYARCFVSVDSPLCYFAAMPTYQDTISSDMPKDRRRIEKKINDSLSLLPVLKNTDAAPFLLYAFEETYGSCKKPEDVDIQKLEELYKVIQLIVSHTVRRRVAHTASNAFNNSAMSVYKNVLTNTDLINEGYTLSERMAFALLELSDSSAFISNEQLRQIGIATSTRSQTLQSIFSYFFIEHENKTFGNNMAGRNSYLDFKMHPNPDSKFAIEHILSQNPKSASEKKLILALKEHGLSVNCLGNLTLLTSIENSTVNASPFEEKKDYYKSAGLNSTRQLATYPHWDLATIKKRNEELTEQFLSFFSHPFDNEELKQKYYSYFPESDNIQIDTEQSFEANNFDSDEAEDEDNPEVDYDESEDYDEECSEQSTSQSFSMRLF